MPTVDAFQDNHGLFYGPDETELILQNVEKKPDMYTYIRNETRTTNTMMGHIRESVDIMMIVDTDRNEPMTAWL